MSDFAAVNLLDVEDSVGDRARFEAGHDGPDIIAVGGPKPEGGDGATAAGEPARRRLLMVGMCGSVRSFG